MIENEGKSLGPELFGCLCRDASVLGDGRCRVRLLMNIPKEVRFWLVAGDG